MPGSMRDCAARSRSQRWNSRVTSSSAMNSTMPARMRTSEMPELADLDAEQAATSSQSRMSAPEKPHCSIRNGSAQMTEREGQGELGQARAAGGGAAASSPKRCSSRSPTGGSACGAARA